MFSVGFSVYVSCKPCKSFFQNIDKFVEHKKQFHFDQLQNTKLIILEERSESGSELGPNPNTPNNWISPIAGTSAQKQTQIHLKVDPTTAKELNSDDMIINQRNPAADPNSGFLVGETNPSNNNKNDQYASGGINGDVASLNSFSANCVHELFPCTTTSRSNLNSEVMYLNGIVDTNVVDIDADLNSFTALASMAQTNHSESAISGNGHRHPQDLDFNLLNNYHPEMRNVSNHNSDPSFIGIDMDIGIGQSNFSPGRCPVTTDLYIPDPVPALLSNINFPNPNPDSEENDHDSISYNSLELNFDSNPQELHHHDNDDDFIRVTHNNFSNQDLNDDEEDDDIKLEVNMNSVFIENEKSDELHPDFLGTQTDDAVSPISFDIPSEDNFNASAIIADLDIVAEMDPDFLVDVFSETDTQHIEDFVETPNFDDIIENIPSSVSVSDCANLNIESVSTPDIHIKIETIPTISSKSKTTSLKISSSKSKPRSKRKFGKDKKWKLIKKSKISLLTKTTAPDSVSLETVALPKSQDPRVRLIRLTPQEILKYCAPANSSSIERQTISKAKRRGRPPKSQNKNKNSKKIKSKAHSGVGVDIRIRKDKETLQQIKTETETDTDTEVVDHYQEAHDIKTTAAIRSDGRILRETTTDAPKSRNLNINFDCKLCFNKLNSSPELEAHLKLCVVSAKWRGKNFCIPCNKHCHNPGGLKAHKPKCLGTKLQNQLRNPISNQGQEPRPEPEPLEFTSKISGAAEKKNKGPITRTDPESLSSDKLLFPCQVCFEQCTSQSSLERHLRTHTRTKVGGNDLKLLSCQLCPFFTHNKNALTKHLRLHPATPARYVLNPRNYYYKCSQLNCDKKFQFTFRLEEHYATDHGLGKGPTVVSCPHPNCLRFFTRQHHLQLHLKSHRSRSTNKQTQRSKNQLTKTSTSVGKFNKNNKGKSSRNVRKNKK